MTHNHPFISIAGESNTGLNRNHNEDSFFIYYAPDGNAAMALIADGIGGHAQGEIASYICCRELFRAASSCSSSNWDEKFLRDTLNLANRKIFDRNFSEERERPMGSTVAAAIFHRDHVITASVGDSRIYRYDPHAEMPLIQLSEDHRPQLQEGRHARKHKERYNIITRSLGTQQNLKLDMQTVPLTPEMKFLLCSDGLYSGLPDSLFAGSLGSDMPMRSVTGKLMREALLSGSHDNITLICAGPAEKEL